MTTMWLQMTVDERPDATTMDGMLCDSLKVLEMALDPEQTSGIPKSLFAHAKGIVILSIIEAGFIVSGSVGTGIIMSRKDAGKWSPPSAVSMAGAAVGLVAGAAYKDVVIFLMDDKTLKSYSGQTSINVGAQANLTVGTMGRSTEFNFNASDKGIGGAVAVAFTKGAFVAATIKGGTLKPRLDVNEQFYGKEATPRDILFGNDKVEIPKDSIIPQIHDLLKDLANGSTRGMPKDTEEKVDQVVQGGNEACESNKDIKAAKEG